MRLGKRVARGALLACLLTSGAAAQTVDKPGAPAPAQAAPAPTKSAPVPALSAAEEVPPLAESTEAEQAPEGEVEAAVEAPAPVPRVVCGLERFEGIPESDARAAAALLCQDLRKHGELVEDHDGEFPPSPEGYRIRIYRLGQRTLLDLSYEKPVGTLKTSVRVEIQSPDELVEESPRLVAALKEGKAPEKRTPPATPVAPAAPKEPGVLMYAGIVGFSTIGDLSGSAGGADLGLSIPVGNFSFTPHGRLAFGAAYVAGLGIDLRFYLSEGPNALFLGAGMGAASIGVDHVNGGGPIGSLLFGAEFNRSTRTRVGFNIRADLPAFTIESTTFDQDYREIEESNYVVPLGANLYVTL